MSKQSSESRIVHGGGIVDDIYSPETKEQVPQTTDVIELDQRWMEARQQTIEAGMKPTEPNILAILTGVQKPRT